MIALAALRWLLPALLATVVVPDEPSALWLEASRLKSNADEAMIRGNIARAGKHYFERCKILRKVDFSAGPPEGHPLNASQDEGFFRTGRLKLRHDAEQLEYLVTLGKLAEKPFLQVAKLFRNMIPSLPRHIHSVDVKPFGKLFDRVHSRAIHLTWPPRVRGPVLHENFDATALQKQFTDFGLPPESEGCEEQNGIAYADNLLSEPVLEALYSWCLESTMWYGSRAGYLAAFLQEAFNAPLVMQVVAELRRALPHILRDHQLMNMWAFKYANNASDWPLNGTAVHADIAAVNVNFWLTPDSANEDPEGGGLIVYTKHAPKEWGFADYNGLDAAPRIQQFLRDSGTVVVPHRRNRVVVFNSNLFHETQVPLFKPGYRNRRINLTFLFGRRCGGAANERPDSYLKHQQEL